MRHEIMFQIDDGNKEDGSCFQSLQLLLKVVLKPSQCAKPIEAIKEQLYSMLFVYNGITVIAFIAIISYKTIFSLENLKGIPLSFSKIKYVDDNAFGRILGEHPWIHIQVRTNLVVFQPLIGAKIRGKVSKVSSSIENVSFLLKKPSIRR